MVGVNQLVMEVNSDGSVMVVFVELQIKEEEEERSKF